MKAVLRAFSICIMGLLHGGCDAPQEPAPAPVELTLVQGLMADREALARGEALFVGSCAGYCHTLGAEATTDASFLFDCEWKHGGSDQDIFDTVTKGVPETRMVGYGANFPEGEADLWRLIAFLRSRQQPCN